MASGGEKPAPDEPGELKSDASDKPTEMTFQFTEITFVTGRTKDFKLSIDGQQVNIPVPEDIFAHLQNQFMSKKTTPQQKQRYATMINLVRAAYKKGFADGHGKAPRGQK